MRRARQRGRERSLIESKGVRGWLNGTAAVDGRTGAAIGGAASKLRKRFCDCNSDELAPISGRPWRSQETEEGLPPKFTIGIVERRRRGLWLAQETEWESRVGTAITR